MHYKCLASSSIFKFSKIIFVYKKTNSSDVWSHRECLLLGVIPQGPLYGRGLNEMGS